MLANVSHTSNFEVVNTILLFYHANRMPIMMVL